MDQFFLRGGSTGQFYPYPRQNIVNIEVNNFDLILRIRVKFTTNKY